MPSPDSIATMRQRAPKPLEETPYQELDQVFVRPSQIEVVRRAFIESPLACVVVVGKRGTGKSTLLNLFARTASDLFPGGIIWASTSSLLTFEQSIVPTLPDWPEPRALVVVDDIDSPEVPKGLVDHLVHDAWDRHYGMNMLLSASSGAQKPDHIPRLAIEVPLAGLSDAEMLEMLEKRLAALPSTSSALWAEGVPERLFRIANGSPRLLLELANAAVRDGNWQSLTTGLVSTTRPGLIDLSGRPLGVGENAARRLTLDVKAADAELMRRVSFDPDLVYTLPPRRFEELAAALFESLGYSVELTPASKDGGKDLYVARRDDLGSLVFFVECKRYARNRPVGVALVRQLHGTVEAGRATGGILLTTSHFTAGARSFKVRSSTASRSATTSISWRCSGGPAISVADVKISN
jgi:restriction system protein